MIHLQCHPTDLHSHEIDFNQVHKCMYLLKILERFQHRHSEIRYDFGLLASSV